MSYEIPQQLQHKEKIIFGLTFSQLAWASLFAGILIIIVKLQINSTAKFILALIPSVIGILFIFFDMATWIKRILSFSKLRTITVTSKSMQTLIPIKKIQKDILQTDKNLAIVEVTPVNFSIKTQEEKQTILYGFQKFLNSLDFPIQIVVSTKKLNIDSYLKALEKRSKNKELMQDFKNFMQITIKENEMRDRKFYIVLPEKSSLEIQSNVCIERLKSIGLKATRIQEKRILNNLHTFFNDNNTIREIEKSSVLKLIAPDVIKDNVNSLKVNEKEYRIISAVGYPRTVEEGFLDKIISSNDDFDISIHIEPFSIESMMIMLNRELQKQRADLFAEKLKNSINPSLEIKYQDTLKVLEAMQKGTQKLFNVSLYIGCKGKTKETLDLLTKKVESELNSIMIVPSVPLFRQTAGFQSMMPLANDKLEIKRNVTTDALSAFFPFSSPFLTQENEGVMLGLNKNKIPFIKDIFALSNANGVVLATSGSGKSYFTKLLISRQLLNDTDVLIIDPQSEYIGLTKHCKGELITISKDSATIINPLDLMGHEYIEKRLTLMDMFKIMFGDLTEIQKAILDKAINETYARKGITAKSNEKRKSPILSDLYKVLEQMDKKASQMEKITYRALLNRLYMYTEGVFSFLNKPSSIGFNNNFVCFNIGNMPKQVKPLVMFLILDYVYMQMKKTKRKKLLIIDEAWSLLGKTEEASYIFEIVKTCRKFNLGLLLITQDVADLVNSKAGHAVLANSSYSFLLRQKPSVIDSVIKTFHLSQMEKEYLLTANQGKGILIMDNDHQELEVVASPEEHKIITTNPNDKALATSTKTEELENVDISLDINQVVFPAIELDMDQQNYLLNNGYESKRFVPIHSIKQQEFFIKKNAIESLEHTFLVDQIKQEMLKLTNDVKVGITREPDLVVTMKGCKPVAIEVETGSNYKKKTKKDFLKKFDEIFLKYDRKVIVFLTDSNYKRQYEKNLPYISIKLRKDVPDLVKLLKEQKSKPNKSKNK
jgi:conjugal transfer ATP-binding protein TraC